ncbi:MAG: ABC transporter permease [Oscillospiraceae bacterium]|nr:ABC transporter permease [Oscillospiraceae bacterium]
MKKSASLIIGLVLLAAVLAAAAVSVFYTPYDPESFSGAKFEAPGTAHLFGTDNFGRDILSRIMKGAGTTLFVALTTVLIGAALGVLVGALTAWYGGVVDSVLMRINDAITAFPSILIALVLVSLLGAGKPGNVILALSIAFVPSFSRVMRTAFATVKNQDYITAARLMGVSTGRILFVHMLPNTLSVLLPSMTIGFNNAVLAEASLSYLGIGVAPPAASLGLMLKDAQSCLDLAPWYAIFTGGAIILTVFAVGLIGNGLREEEGGG